jgi:ADP-dependent NAD(P)H-hydrate dehydratase / NAD(P)H-hydrate epimerase
MDKPYWHRQTSEKPLFPQLAWSRPEHRASAGKLLIIGGNVHGFAAPAEAYAESQRAGIGVARALLPNALRRIVGILIEQAEFAPSTPSGSFSQRALNDALSLAAWADGTLFVGDLGRNAETAILVEKFLHKAPGPVTLTKDAVDYMTSLPGALLERDSSLLVLSLAQLQRLGTAVHTPSAVRFGMDILQLTDWLHEFTTRHKPHLIVRHLDTVFVAVNGQVSTTRLADPSHLWRLKTATHASVWWLQNPEKPFEALTASMLS